MFKKLIRLFLPLTFLLAIAFFTLWILLSIGHAGSLDIGTYQYKIVHVNENVATDGGDGSFSIGSAAEEVTTTSTNKTVRLVVPAPADTNAVTHVYVYRSQLGDFSQYYMLTVGGADILEPAVLDHHVDREPLVERHRDLADGPERAVVPVFGLARERNEDAQQ